MFDSIRTAIPAGARAAWYATAGAVVTALVAWGILDDSATPAVVGVATAAITLLFAIVHSDSPVRQAGYGLAAAVGVLGVYLGWGTEAQIDSLLAVIAPALGLGAAAATTNTGDATYVGEHRLEP